MPQNPEQKDRPSQVSKRSGIGKRYTPPPENNGNGNGSEHPETNAFNTPDMTKAPKAPLTPKIRPQNQPDQPKVQDNIPSEKTHQPTSPKTTPTPSLIEKIKPLENRKHTLEEIFNRVQGEPKTEDNPYFINQIRTNFNLQEADLHRLQLVQPYYEDIEVVNKRVKSALNKYASPYYEHNFITNQRFATASTITGELGLTGLAAASAPTPEMQAELFRIIARQILSIHQHNPNLLMDWYQAQHQQEGLNSLKMFQYLDSFEINPQTGNFELKSKPDDQRLVTFNRYEIPKIWHSRTLTLQTSLASNHFRPEEFSWLGFLSHSVNLDQVLRAIKTGSKS